MIPALCIAAFFGFMFALSATSIWPDTRQAILHWRAIRAELRHIDGGYARNAKWRITQ